MEDDELKAIRAARLQELQQSGGGSGGVGPSFPGGGFGGAQGNGGQRGPSEEELAAQQEMKRQMLSRVLEGEARERLSRIGLVKPEKERAISDLLLQMAQTGQLRGRVSEDQLIQLLDQVESKSGGGGQGSGAGKITYTRKKAFDDDDDDFDL